MINNYTFCTLRLYGRTLIALLAMCCMTTAAHAQIVVSADKTAAALASALVGTGVTIISPTLTCAGNANGTFVTTVVDPIGISNGIILTTGCAKDTTIGGIDYFGVAGPYDPTGFLTMPNRANGSPQDPYLTSLLPGSGPSDTSADPCILEFDFKAAGDTVKFNYVFGSAEYAEYTCSSFNDIFAFVITGGIYTSPTNIALIPGTSIPVCINSVNCGATGSWPLSTCTSLGVGSPFCAYYVNNLTGVDSPYVRYAGFTRPLTAVAVVNPCDTYHLKLAIADADDEALDSGVFLEGGSLSSAPPPMVSASGIPYRIRGCAPGQFVFTIPAAVDSDITIHYVISGSAVNGYDYAHINDSVILTATTTSVTLPITPLLVPAAGPRVVTIGIVGHNPCTGTDSVIASASITILDSFSFHIVTPDTAICLGQNVNIIAIGDTAFASVMHYRWTPAATLSDDTLLTPIATPVVTTTYMLRDSLPPIYGCPVETRQVTIRVYTRPVLTTDSALVKTCVGAPVPLHVYAAPSTVPDTYLWSPGADLTSTTIYNPVATPAVAGDVVYTVSVSPAAVPGCTSTSTITVHTLGAFTLNTPDTAICINTVLPVSVTGSSEFSWAWSPALFVSNVVLMEPLISPVLTSPPATHITYVVTASYAHCPDMTDTLQLEIDYPAPTKIVNDTICLGGIDSLDFTVPGGAYYHYQWTPPAFLSNDTAAYPVISPTAPGTYSWTVTIEPHAVGCADTGIVNMIVTPNSFTITPTDTAVCRGASVKVTGDSYYLFHYQWLPTAGIPLSTIVDPLITADTGALYVVTATFSKCPDMHDTLRLDVQPNPEVYLGGSKFVCASDSLHLRAAVIPGWYTHYAYSWSPASALDNTTMQAVVFHSGADTTVIVTVSTPQGCKGTDSAHITVRPGNFASIDTNIKDFCPHEGFMPLVSGASTYHWSPVMYLSDSASGQPLITPITSQTYSIVATSQYGCRDTLYFTAIVHPAAVISLPETITLYPGESYQMDPLSNCTSFAWFPPAGLTNYMIANPVANPEISTKYILKGTTEYGCKAEDSIDVLIDIESILALPNAFSPGSGVNNEFKIIKRGIATLKYFRIFNRWGNLVFETTDIDKGWNGEYNGAPQQTGVYVYQVEAVTSAGKIFEKHGNTTLLR